MSYCNKRAKSILLIAVCMLLCLPAVAHVIPYELDRMEGRDVFTKYLILGYEHIIPKGFDHILFILCIFFLSTNIKKLILQATMFTLAHSITLGLAVYGIIDPPADIVEPLIALSILLLALENIFYTQVRPRRLAMVFIFGLVHGMGFAGVLHELGMPRYAFFNALISFNVGVELGQLTIIAVMYFLVAKTCGQKPWYRKRIVIPVSVIIGLIAAYWTVERIFFSVA